MDDRGTQLSHYTAQVKPKGGMYQVAPKALEINNIDLREHARVAAPADDVVGGLVGYLDDSRYQGQPLILVGWNVTFDRGFLKHQLLGFEKVARLFGYRTMELHAV